ncbi:MAG: hypothetical protein ACI8T1_004082 [Verrucomicrobiales bacterium]|jgi:hypothetical protein
MVRLLTAVSALLIGVFGADWQTSGGSGKALLKAAKDNAASVSFFGGSPDPQTSHDDEVTLAVGSSGYDQMVLIHGAHVSFSSLRGASQHAAQRSGYPPRLA